VDTQKIYADVLNFQLNLVMNDDIFSNLISSNKPHSVSVSEHSGNATTPKNIVSSASNDPPSNKTIFDKNKAEKINEAIHQKNESENKQYLEDDSAASRDIQTTRAPLKNNHQGLDDGLLNSISPHIIHSTQFLNFQIAPEKEATEINLQAIDNANLKDHFEVVSTSKNTLKKIDLGIADKQISSSTQQALSKDGLNKLPSFSIVNKASSLQPELTAQQTEKLKREKLKEEFQGRVAVIRRNVKTLNGKLDSFDTHA
jgi:hypothetical protein